jgi:predicted nucleic acid-binding protein
MVVVDSDVLIWVLRGDAEATGGLRNAVIVTEGSVYITPVQIAEIYAGLRPREKPKMEGLLASIGTLDIVGVTGKLAGEFLNQYAKSHGVTLADAMIAAAVRLNSAELWTRNRKHYPMLESAEFYRAAEKGGN